jgi:hypothetical protein
MSFGREFEHAMANHIAEGGDFAWNAERGTTIAFKQTGRNMVEIAVAHCNVNDTFDEAVGKAIALDNFIDCHTIMVRLEDDEDIDWLMQNYAEIL